MQTAYLCIALLGLLTFGLALNVSMNRRRRRIPIGLGDDDGPLHRASVAHSNAAEFNPLLCIMMLALERWGSANWVVWLFGASVAARYLHTYGLLSHSLHRPHWSRVGGAAGTYVCGLLMSLLLLYWVFRPGM